jgi:hypothetical protein
LPIKAVFSHIFYVFLLIAITTGFSNNENMNADSAASMAADEYSKLIAKWQEAYYAWNASCATYCK